MQFWTGLLIATLFWISIFAYASFNGYIARSTPVNFNGYVVKGRPDPQQLSDDTPLFDARGHKIP